MRLIDADRLEDTWDQGKTMIDNVEAQPTVDPVKHGHWEITEDLRVCSECRMAVYGPLADTKIYEYCPWCDAKMDGVTE